MIKWEFSFEQGGVAIYPTPEEDERFAKAMLQPEAGTSLIRLPAVNQDVYVNMNHVKVVIRADVQPEKIAAPEEAEKASEEETIDIAPLPPTA